MHLQIIHNVHFLRKEENSAYFFNSLISHPPLQFFTHSSPFTNLTHTYYHPIFFYIMYIEKQCPDVVNKQEQFSVTNVLDHQD